MGDENATEAKEALREAYGKDCDITKYFVYHRLFFIACAELFDLNNGNEYFVTHYCLKSLSTRQARSSHDVVNTPSWKATRRTKNDSVIKPKKPFRGLPEARNTHTLALENSIRQKS